MAIKEFPYIKHRQRVNRGQAERFFNDVRNWLALANRSVAELKNSKPGRSYVLDKLRKIQRGMNAARQHLAYLRSQNFQNNKIERELRNLGERIEELDHL